jgi:hypothetical protein
MTKRPFDLFSEEFGDRCRLAETEEIRSDIRFHGMPPRRDGPTKRPRLPMFSYVTVKSLTGSALQVPFLGSDISARQLKMLLEEVSQNCFE